MFIVFVERAMRKILINYPKRQMGNKVYGGDSSHLPLKINSAGVIPAIFASALLLLPVTFSNFNASQNETFQTIAQTSRYKWIRIMKLVIVIKINVQMQIVTNLKQMILLN